MKNFLAIGLTTIFFCACGDGSDDSSQNPTTGTVYGFSFNFVSAVFSTVAYQSSNDRYVIVAFSDMGDLCTQFKGGKVRKNESRMIVSLENNTGAGSTGAITAGSYTIVEPTIANPPLGKLSTAAFGKKSGQCSELIPDNNAYALNGQVQVQAISSTIGGSASGSFDLNVGAQNDDFNGTFNAVFCDLPNGVLPNAVCQ